MSKIQKLSFGVAGITFLAWLATSFVFQVEDSSSLLWVALIAFATGFGALTIEYARAVAREDAEHG